MRNKYTDKEIKILLDNIVILTDTREQKGDHVTSYFDKAKVKHKAIKLDSADYSVMIESNSDTEPIIGDRDIYFDRDIAIERKNSIDELANSIKDRVRFSAEFDRAVRRETRVLLFVEDKNGLENIISHNYRSEYKPFSLYASIKAFENRYNFTTKYIDKKLIGMEIHYTLLYYVREQLR